MTEDQLWRVCKTPEPRKAEHCTKKKRPACLLSICASDQMFARQSLSSTSPQGNLLVLEALKTRGRPPAEGLGMFLRRGSDVASPWMHNKNWIPDWQHTDFQWPLVVLQPKLYLACKRFFFPIDHITKRNVRK